MLFFAILVPKMRNLTEIYMYLVIYHNLIYYLCRIIVISFVTCKDFKETVKNLENLRFYRFCTFFGVRDPMGAFFI